MLTIEFQQWKMEIKKVVEYPDRRIKSLVYTMASSGIRIGAWNYLQWGHIRPVKKDDEIVAAKLIVYAGVSYQVRHICVQRISLLIRL